MLKTSSKRSIKFAVQYIENNDVNTDIKLLIHGFSSQYFSKYEKPFESNNKLISNKITVKIPYTSTVIENAYITGVMNKTRNLKLLGYKSNNKSATFKKARTVYNYGKTLGRKIFNTTNFSEKLT